METKYPKLFEPIKIGKLEIKNRIAMAATSDNMADAQGYIGDRLLAFYAARAKGGYGLIIGPPSGHPSPERVTKLPELAFHPNLRDATRIPGWSALVETLHAFGAKQFVQLGPYSRGRQGKRGVPTVAASPIPLHIPPENLPEKAVKYHKAKGYLPFMQEYLDIPAPVEATAEEMRLVEDKIADQAEIFVKTIGVDGIDIHACHGYVGYSFLSPRTNHRTDEYGGSLENRTRLARNTITKIRAKVGPDVPVGFRTSCSEHMPGGLSLEETIKIAKMMEDWGADFIDLSNGCWEAFKWFVPDEDGINVAEAAEIKKAVKIPIITTAIHDPAIGNKAIAEGKTDMMQHSRQALVDPEYPNKVKEGRPVTKCIRCNVCWTRLNMGVALRCSENPLLGFEHYSPEYNMLAAPNRKTYFITKA